jgi:hypothetical protein
MVQLLQALHQIEVSETDINAGLSTAPKYLKIGCKTAQKRCLQPNPGTPTNPRYGVRLHPPVAGSHIAVIAIICELAESLIS